MTSVAITPPRISVKKGYLLLYRIFDVAEEINVSQIEAILRDNRGPDRFKVPRYIDRGIVMKNPPVTFGLGEEIITVKCDRKLMEDVRRNWPFFRDRRIDYYDGLTKRVAD